MKFKSKFTMKQEYAISRETTVILPNHDENGFLNSKICKRDGISHAELSPFNLIDTNLRFRGSSIRGAMEGAQAILDKKNMNPLILDKEREIILIPCWSPFREDCVWVSLKHVKSYHRSGNKKTRVLLSSGHTIILDVSEHSFSQKVLRAYELLYKIQAQKENFEEKAMEAGVQYHLIKGDGERNYRGGIG